MSVESSTVQTLYYRDCETVIGQTPRPERTHLADEEVSVKVVSSTAEFTQNQLFIAPELVQSRDDSVGADDR